MTDGPSGPCAMAWSGGKDSTLALHRARVRGLDVPHLFTICDGETDRIPYHGLRSDVLRAQASALDREPTIAHTREDTDFEAAFEQTLDTMVERGVEAIVFGNIHLEEVREWYEERVRARGLDHVEPLWGGEPSRLVREFLHLGYRARIVSVQEGSAADASWVGRELDADLVEEILARDALDPCGERGEFHSFCWDGPLFRRPVAVEEGEPVVIEGHRVLDLTVPAAS